MPQRKQTTFIYCKRMNRDVPGTTERNKTSPKVKERDPEMRKDIMARSKYHTQLANKCEFRQYPRSPSCCIFNFTTNGARRAQEHSEGANFSFFQEKGGEK